MTKRDFYSAIIKANLSTEITDLATAELSALDRKNEKAKTARLARVANDAPIITAITDYLATHKVALANELATACKVSTPKAVAVCARMVDEGAISVKQVSVPKVGKRNAYSLIVAE